MKTAARSCLINVLSPERKGWRRGSMLILVMLVLVILLVTVAFSVDIAYMQLTRTRLRTATDAAARASGEALSRLQDANAARQAAKTIAAKNMVASAPLILEDRDIIFGNSEKRSNGSWRFTANGTPVNSIQIHGRRTSDSASGSVPLFFARMFGVNDFEPTEQATALRTDRDICLVVDRSSSMKLDLATTAQTMSTADARFALPPRTPDSRWAAMQSAVQVFTDHLATTPQAEKVALVSFGSDCTYFGVTNRVSDLDQPLDLDESRIGTAVATISSRVFNGATDTSAGIDRGVEALTDSRARPYAMKTMVFLTDGFRTQGRLPIDAANDAADENITIYTVTFGAAFDQSEMIAVAAATGGTHYHASTAAELRDVFAEIARTIPVLLTE